MLKNILAKKSLIVALSGFLIIGAGYFVFTRNGDPEMELEEVVLSRLEWDIFDTGTLKRGEEISLGFEQAGTISALHVSRGNEASRGALLAEIDNTSTRIRLTEAQQRLRAAELELQRARVGATGQNIDIRETALDNARQSLEDAISSAETRLNNIYSGASTVANSAYLTSFDTLEVTEDMIDRYFTKFLTNDARTARSARDEIKNSVDAIREWRNILRDDFTYDNAAEALPVLEKEIDYISANLDVMIDIMENWDAVTDENVTLMKKEKIAINTSLSELVSINSSVSSVKVQNTAEINAAEGAVRQAERELSLITADARDEDISILETRVTQANLEISLLRDRLDKTVIRAPFAGTVTRIHRRSGEIAPIGQPVLSFMPQAEFFVEANIYEGDISRVSVGDRVRISFVAFSNEEYEGEVVAIDSASTLVDGVVYYTVTIAPEELPEGARAGMTTDISILATAEEDSLNIPESAVRREDGRTLVDVRVNGRIEEREVVLGSRGANRTVEILSGLEPGDRVVVGR